MKFLTKLLPPAIRASLLGAFLCLCCVASAQIVVLTGGYTPSGGGGGPGEIGVPNATGQLWVNNHEANYFQKEHFFLDHFKSCGNNTGSWVPRTGGVPDETLATQIEVMAILDENGWPTSLESWDSLEIICMGGGSFPEAASMDGRYKLIFDGEGTIDLSSSVGLSNFDVQANYIEFDFTVEGGGIILKITDTDPDIEGNYLRNMHLYKLSNEAAFEAGTVINPLWAAKYDNIKLIRFLGYNQTIANDGYFGDGNIPTPETRPTDDFYTYSVRGISIEDTVAASNQEGFDIFWTIPHYATIEYTEAIAQYVHDNLDSRRKFYLEWSNETWNNQGEGSPYLYLILEMFADPDWGGALLTTVTAADVGGGNFGYVEGVAGSIPDATFDDTGFVERTIVEVYSDGSTSTKLTLEGTSVPNVDETFTRLIVDGDALTGVNLLRGSATYDADDGGNSSWTWATGSFVGGAGDHDIHIVRAVGPYYEYGLTLAAEHMDAAAAIYADDMSRLVRVAGAQAAFPSLCLDSLEGTWSVSALSMAPPHTHFDAVGITSYWTSLDGYDWEDLIDRIEDEMTTPEQDREYFAESNLEYIDTILSVFYGYYIDGDPGAFGWPSASDLDLEIILYEGGAHSGFPFTTSNNALLLEFFFDYYKSQEMREVYEAGITQWETLRDLGDVHSPYMQFTTLGSWGVWGYWGVVEDLDEVTPRYEVLMEYNAGTFP